MPDVKEELNRSVREGRIESRHSIKSLQGMRPRSHDCDTSSNHGKVAVAFPVTSVEVTCSEAM